MFVKITSCGYPNRWYSTNIGQIIEVEEEPFLDSYIVVHAIRNNKCLNFIMKEDCMLLDNIDMHLL